MGLASSRTSWISSRSPAPRRIASCWKPISRNGPPANCNCRPASRRSNASSSRPACASATSAAAARNCACRAIFPASPARWRPALPNLIWMAATWPWGWTFSGAISARSASPATTRATPPTRRFRPASRFAPAFRSPNSGRRRCAMAFPVKKLAWIKPSSSPTASAIRCVQAAFCANSWATVRCPRWAIRSSTTA